MMSRIITTLLCVCLVKSAFAVDAQNTIQWLTTPDPDERIVFSTTYGDMVFALYPNLAPNHVKHIKRLVELKLYDKVYVARVINDFVFQFSEIYRQGENLTDEQKAALHPIKAEFSNDVQHLRGRLSLAHKNNEPDSGMSSFSVILGNAGHLDGKYTIFGELESGWSVINKVLQTSNNGVAGGRRVIVNQAYIVSNIAEYYETHPKDTDTYVAPVKKETQTRKGTTVKEVRVRSDKSLLEAIVVLTIVNVLLGVVAFAFYNKWQKSHLRSLGILNLLVSGFTLMILSLSIEQSYAWIGGLLFIILVGMLRVMSRFEN